MFMRKLHLFVLVIGMIAFATGIAHDSMARDVGPPETESAYFDIQKDVVDLSSDLSFYPAPIHETLDVGYDQVAQDNEDAIVISNEFKLKSEGYAFIDRHRRLSIEIVENDNRSIEQPPSYSKRE